MRSRTLFVALLLVGVSPLRAQDQAPAGAGATPPTRVTHALSLFGDVKYPADFVHYDYVNPAAPKGGTVRLSSIGGFDTLNPFNSSGTPALGLALIYDQLLATVLDEPSTAYGQLAQSVEVPADVSWALFTLRDNARWHDGKPVTPDDVIFSLKLLKEKGQPIYRFYYANVVDAVAVGAHGVKFIFDQGGNRELPLILGQLVVLPKHYWEGKDANGEPRDFTKSTLEPPLGSGPYRIGKFEVNRTMGYQRVPDYWGAELPVNVGMNNFDEIRYEYYRDPDIALTAFFADEYDIRLENSAKNWATAYADAPAFKNGAIKKEMIPIYQPARAQGFFFNLRRAKFQDRRVREAIGLVMNFEWMNKNLFYDQYTRTTSYFDNSELAAKGLPSAGELKLLEPFRAQLPPEIFTQEFKVPVTDGTGTFRGNLTRALKLLTDAGWSTRDQIMTHAATGEKLEIEFLLADPGMERIVQPFLRDLERIGIRGTIRIVDTSQYVNRLDHFDFDVVIAGVPQSLSPGNEQREYWGTETADREGSRNISGIKDPVVDALIEKIILAPDRAALVTATQALDRVLLWGHYMVPHWYVGGDRYAYWDRFGRPAVVPKYDPGIPLTWWSRDAVKNAAR